MWGLMNGVKASPAGRSSIHDLPFTIHRNVVDQWKIQTVDGDVQS